MKKMRTKARPKAPVKMAQTTALPVAPAAKPPEAVPPKPPPKKILLVDDDAVILAIYGKRLTAYGFTVATATDGLNALDLLQVDKPDLVVLDLMMPKLSGVEVLKFIRSQTRLRSIPVAIFTNAFMDELAQAAIEIGVQRTVIKAECNPAKLIAIANDLLVKEPTVVMKPPSAVAPAELRQVEHDLEVVEASSSTKSRLDFLRDAPSIIVDLRELYKAFRKSPDLKAREERLDAFYRKVHFVTAITGLARYHHIALLSGVFEALLFELQRTPDLINPSTLRTIAMTLDFLGVLFAMAREPSADEPLVSKVMIVDDDAVTNRVAIFALQRAHLQANAVEDPQVALKLLAESRYELVLLDIEMPLMNGFEFCQKLRAIPGYEKTPVIYVTIHSDFESRTKGVLSGGDDLIAKPFLPIELAVKVVMHLIKRRLPQPTGTAESQPAPAELQHHAPAESQPA